jgi:hypothetical protein
MPTRSGARKKPHVLKCHSGEAAFGTNAGSDHLSGYCSLFADSSAGLGCVVAAGEAGGGCAATGSFAAAPGAAFCARAIEETVISDPMTIA